MNNPTEYLGYGISATMKAHGAIVLTHAKSGNYLHIPEEVFQAMCKFRAAAQVEIALKQNLEPAYQFVNDNKK